MTYQPIIPLSGYSGWKFLNRTLVLQKAAFDKAPDLKRDIDYFKANIGKIDTAEQLVADHRLLSVTLGAFGLDADIKAKAFIKKVLADGTLTTGALATRLSDKRYLEMSKTFGFGDFAVPSTKISDFGDRIVALYQERQFEAAVGNQDSNLRLALALPRDLGAVAAKASSDATKWFTIMGNLPLRQVFQTAFGLPSSFGGIDLDKQLETLQSRAQAIFGDSSVSQFTKPEKVEKLVRLFLLKSDVASVSATTSRASTVLGMLQDGQSQLNSLLGR